MFQMNHSGIPVKFVCHVSRKVLKFLYENFPSSWTVASRMLQQKNSIDDQGSDILCNKFYIGEFDNGVCFDARAFAS